MAGFLGKKWSRCDVCHCPCTKPARNVPSSSTALRLSSSRTITQQGSPAERLAPLSYIQLLQHSIYMTDSRVHLYSALITLNNAIPQRRWQLQPHSWGQAGRTLEAKVQPLGMQVGLSAVGTSSPESLTGLFSRVTHGHSCLIHSLAQLQNIYWNHFHPAGLGSISSRTTY